MRERAGGKGDEIDHQPENECGTGERDVLDVGESQLDFAVTVMVFVDFKGVRVFGVE